MDRTELGRMLRTWRERLQPSDVGLPAGTRRRTPGLRREEVSGLAGVSVDYLNRLEQGRGPHPSEAVLTALGRALRLDRPERDHLFRLAGATPPGPGRIGRDARPAVLRLMDRFTDLPAVLLNARKDVLAWNPMAAALFGDWSAVPVDRRNLLLAHFVDGTSRMVAGSAAETERLGRALVSDARDAVARYPGDPDLGALLAELRRRSRSFSVYWEEREVIEHDDDRKSFAHPQIGTITLDCVPLYVGSDDQFLLVFSATPGSTDAELLSLLRVLGTQEIASPT